MTIDMIIWLWAILGTCAYMLYIGWTNLENGRNENILAMTLCGPITQFILIAIVVTWLLETGAKGFYSVRCAYQEWRKSLAG